MDSPALYRLLSWLSPSYPISAYSYSHGFETLIQKGDIKDREDLVRWLTALLMNGSGRNDLILLGCAYQWDSAAELAHLAEYALSFQSSLEIARETTRQGAAFLKTTRAAWPQEGEDNLPEICPYPIVVGRFARLHDIPLIAVQHAMAHGFAANLVSAAIRLIPLGQADGQQAISQLETVIHQAVEQVQEKDLADLSNNCWRAEIASMKHETQNVRLFQS